MYGTQAQKKNFRIMKSFENDVKMYGTQAVSGTEMDYTVFENDVKMYGTQADLFPLTVRISLRMM